MGEWVGGWMDGWVDRRLGGGTVPVTSDLVADWRLLDNDEAAGADCFLDEAFVADDPTALVNP